MARVGVNRPPDAPARNEATVASGLSTVSATSASSGRLPPRTVWTGPFPLPSRAGSGIASAPIAAKTGVVASGSRHPVGTPCRDHPTNRTNPTPAHATSGAATTANTTTGALTPGVPAA